MTIFAVFFLLFWLQILNLPASLQNNNTRVGPFPWKPSVLQNPDRERTNQSTGICLRLGLPYYKYIYLSNRKRFPYLHSLIQTRGGLGEFETVMQTRDEVEGLHNCREFSRPLECLYQVMQTQEKSFLLLL